MRQELARRIRGLTPKTPPEGKDPIQDFTTRAIQDRWPSEKVTRWAEFIDNAQVLRIQGEGQHSYIELTISPFGTVQLTRTPRIPLRQAQPVR